MAIRLLYLLAAVLAVLLPASARAQMSGQATATVTFPADGTYHTQGFQLGITSESHHTFSITGGTGLHTHAAWDGNLYVDTSLVNTWSDETDVPLSFDGTWYDEFYLTHADQFGLGTHYINATSHLTISSGTYSGIDVVTITVVHP